MAENNNSDAFNLLAQALQNQLDAVMTELAQKPNQLLLRCVQMQDYLASGKNGEKPKFTDKEYQYLKKNLIAQIKEDALYSMGEWDGISYKIEYFLPPWQETFSGLAAKLRDGTPAMKVAPQLS